MCEINNITGILKRFEEGDPAAGDELLNLVYQELHRLAVAKLVDEKPGQTLQATALVHEAWLRLVDVDYVQTWTSRRHFFGAAAEAMRRILVDKSRRRSREKHGGGWERITIEIEDVPVVPGDDLLEALDHALERFATIDPIATELVKLRYFAGLTLRDAGKTLDLPPRSADRLWAYAKAWLHREIQHRIADD